MARREHMRPPIHIASLATCLLLACGGVADGDAGSPPDGGLAPDATAATLDAGPTADSGAAAMDAGADTDAGPTDAGAALDGGAPPAREPLLFDVGVEAPGLPRGSRLLDDITGDGVRDAIRIGRHPDDLDLRRVTLYVASAGVYVERGVIDMTSFGVDLADVSDFDGDGNADLAFLRRHRSGRFWRILYGAGDGTVAREEEIEGAGELAGFADFNGDGRTDVVLRRGDRFSRGLDIWMSDPGGGARSFVSLGRARGDGPFLTGDFDGNGRLDVLELPGHVTLQETGGFASGPIEVEALAGCDGGTVYDLDGDGRDDVVAFDEDGFPDGDVVVLGAEPGGSFTEDARYVVSDPRHVTVGDLDADGRLDLVVSDGSRVFEVFYGDGLGFGGDRDRYVNYLGWPSTEIVDMDADGRPDLLADRRFIHYGGAGRALRAPRVSTFRDTGFPMQFMARFDADTLADMVTFHDDGSVTYRPLDADRRLGDPVMCMSPGPPGTNRILDVDGDGRLDQLHVGPSVLTTWINSGGCATEAPVTSPIAPRRWGILAADLDGDGATDIAWSEDASVQVARGDGSGGFAAATSSPLTVSWGALHAGAVGGSSALDLVRASSDGDEFTVLLGDGALGFTQGATIGVPGLGAVETGDVDGDGDLDILAVLREAMTELRLYRNEGGAFGAPEHIASIGPFELQVALADLDADGAAELLTVDASFARVIRIAGAPEEIFAFPIVDPVQILDADGDGDLDLAVREGRSGADVLSIIQNRTVDP